MDSCSTETMVLSDVCDPLSPSPPIANSSSPMVPPTASTPITGPPQVEQCVYVLSPWRRTRPVFTNQPPPPNNPGFRFPHPTPATVGLLRVAPYRHYYPGVPARPPGTVPREFQDYRYDYYNNAFAGAPDFRYAAGQEMQPEESGQKYDSLYTAYPHQPPMYPYGQQWSHTVAYNPGEAPDKSQALFYPENVKLETHSDFADVPNGTATASVTKKSVRVKFMGPDAMYLTTKTLEMQEQNTEPGEDSPSQVNMYENLRSCSADEGPGPNDIVIQTSTDEDTYQDDEERVTFGSIEEALASIDPTSLADEDPAEPSPVLEDKPFIQVSAVEDKPFIQVSTVAYQGLRMADEKQEEVIKAAKSLFSKRTRTLYHWLYPQTSKNKLKATVSAAWETLHENEKQFYVSQVLGRFGLQASSLMINPQLDGIKGLPTEVLQTADRQRAFAHESGKSASVEAQQAVDQLFASCADSESWTSYTGSSAASCSVQSPSLAATAFINPIVAPPSRSAKPRGFGGSHSQDSRRKRSHSRMSAETGGRARLGPVNDHLDEEVSILKRMRESKLDPDFDEDSELTNDLEKYRVMSQDSDRHSNCRDGDDFWRRTPDPEDLFTHLEF